MAEKKTSSWEDKLDKKMKNLEKRVEEIGKKVEDKGEEFGKRVEDKAKAIKKDFVVAVNKYNTALKMLNNIKRKHSDWDMLILVDIESKKAETAISEIGERTSGRSFKQEQSKSRSHSRNSKSVGNRSKLRSDTKHPPGRTARQPIIPPRLSSI